MKKINKGNENFFEFVFLILIFLLKHCGNILYSFVRLCALYDLIIDTCEES